MGYRLKITLPIKPEDSMESTDQRAIEMARGKFLSMGYNLQGKGEVLHRLVFTQDEEAVCEHLVEIGN